MKRLFFVLCLLLGQMAVWGQDYDRDHNFLEKVYELKVAKKGEKYQVEILYSEKSHTFEITHLDINIFQTRFSDSLEAALNNKDGIPLEQYKKLLGAHSRSVFMSLYTFFLSQTPSNDPQAGIITIKDNLKIYPSVNRNMLLPTSKTGLILGIDELHQQIFDELFINTNCCETCNCLWWQNRIRAYYEIFDDQEYYRFISKGRGKEFPSITGICQKLNCLGTQAPTCNDYKRGLSEVKPKNYIVEQVLQDLDNLISQIKASESTSQKQLIKDNLLNAICKAKLHCQPPLDSAKINGLTKIHGDVDSIAQDYVMTTEPPPLDEFLHQKYPEVAGVADLITHLDQSTNTNGNNRHSVTVMVFPQEVILRAQEIYRKLNILGKNDKKLDKQIDKLKKVLEEIQQAKLTKTFTNYKYSTRLSESIKSLRIYLSDLLKAYKNNKSGIKKQLKQYYVDRSLLLEKLKKDNEELNIRCCNIKTNIRDSSTLHGLINHTTQQINKNNNHIDSVGKRIQNTTEKMIKKITRINCITSLNIGPIQNLSSTLSSLDSAIKTMQPTSYSTTIDSLIRNLEINIDSTESNIKILDKIYTQLLKGNNKNSNPCNQFKKDLPKTIDSLREDLQSLREFQNNVHQYSYLKERLQFNIGRKQKMIDSLIKSYPLENIYLNIDSVQMEFEEGMLRNIIVSGKYGGVSYKLFNRYPIPFSVLTDMEKIRDIKLYEPVEYKFAILLSDVIDYTPRLQSRSDDYSPMDNVYEFTPQKTPQILYKEKSTEIIRGRVFTDFIGFTGDQPNGLIQTEVGRRFNLYSQYFPVFFKSPGKRPGYKTYFGVLNYAEPTLLISKMESNNRRLTALTTQLPPPQTQVEFAGTMDYYKYMNFYFRPVYVNLGSFFTPTIKSSFHLDFGVAWARTDLVDTVKTTVNNQLEVKDRTRSVNSTVFNLSIVYHLRPDTRYGFSLTNEFKHWKTWSADFKQAGDTAAFKVGADTRELNWIYTLQFNAFYKPFKRDLGEIYFRFAYNMLVANPRQNFLQAQLGYAFRILYK